MSNVLLGGAIGDALGVPFETMLFNDPRLIDWDGKTFIGSDSHKLKPGQFSDDTQMSLMVAESLIENNGFDPDDLSKRYVEWIVSGRARGYGKTTYFAIQNILSGKHWGESGIANSFGNGTAMRAAPFGIYYRNDIDSLVSVCRIDANITHASKEAEAGSIAIALVAAHAVNNDMEDLIERVHEKLPNSKVKETIYSLDSLINMDEIDYRQVLHILGTKADVRETVPAALYCFLKFDNYHQAIVAAIKAGGDTDTTAAIVGGLFGAKLGMGAIDRSFFSIESFERLVQLDSQLYNRSSKNILIRR